MKNLLKIMSVLTLTGITVINVTACNVLQNSPVNYNQVLADAANLIANNKYPNFTNFLQDKNKTNVSDFETLIKENISNLFRTAQEDFSNLTYDIINGGEEIKTITTINIHLAVYDTTAIKKCSFQAHFNSLQDYINEKLRPLVDGTQYLSISKDDKGGFYQDLIKAGATFKREDKSQTEQYLRNSSPAANTFWAEFQQWKPSKIKNPLLANVLEPLLLFIGDSPTTGLTFDNFKPYLLSAGGHSDVIVITGNKKFNDNKYYDYIKIGLAGEKSDTADLGNKYQGLTFIFSTNS